MRLEGVRLKVSWLLVEWGGRCLLFILDGTRGDVR
jgi:hypothetical protein